MFLLLMAHPAVPDHVASRVRQIEAIFTAPPKKIPTYAVPDGPLMGNGDVGVVLSGSPDNLTFHISKNDFWRAVSHYSDGSPKPIGTLRLTSPALKGASYHVRQRLWEADILGEFASGSHKLKVRAWTPATANALVVQLRNEGPVMDLDVSLDPSKGEGSVETQTANLITRSFITGVEWPSEAAIALGVNGKRATSTHVTLHLEAGKDQWIRLGIRTNHDARLFTTDAENGVEEPGTHQLEHDHRRWWSEFWHQSAIQIDDPLIERFWYGSQYLMAMCSRNREFPPGLFGNWITTDHPSWAGDYHLNYNYQAPWWGVYSSNHVSLAEPYDAPLLEAIPRGRANAAQLLGMPGVYLEVGIGPKGLLSCKSPDYDLFWGQKSDAAYATVDMLMRWRATRDMEYLSKRAYPFLREVARFWEKYLVKETGRYVIKDDAIHEGSGNDTNPILTLGLLRNLFTGMIDASRALGVDGDVRPEWQAILENLSPYPTQVRNGKTVFRYTEKGMAWNDGNSLGIQHIYPSGAIGLSSDPSLLDVSRNMIAEMARWSDYNAFPTFYTAAVRVGYDPETILGHLRQQLEQHGMPNLFVYYGGGGIECCSAVPTCINEMLLQSYEGVVRLFPVWPKGKDAEFWSLRADGSFLVSSAIKAGVIAEATIASEKGSMLTLQMPADCRSVTVETGGKKTEVGPFSTGGSTLSMATKIGGIYRIRFHRPDHREVIE